MKTNVLSALFFAAGTLAGADATPAACCVADAKPVTAPAACCAVEATAAAARKSDGCCAPALAIAPFSKESIYQLDASFTDDTGKPFALGSLRGRPVVVAMFFASCGYACPLTVTDLLAIQGRLPAELRKETAFVLVTFDIARDTTAVLAKYRTTRGLDAQWTLLRGNDDAVRELAALLGVKFKQEADGAFAHSNLITILNREGEVAHHRVGLKGGLDEAAAALAAAMKR